MEQITQFDASDTYSPTEGDYFDALKDINPDVSQADLSKYAEDQLEGRRSHYEREYSFERDPSLRADFKQELDRTEGELRRRRTYRTAEADRVFAI